MTSSRIDRCPLCGRFEPIERDHIIRKANSDDTSLIGSVCHHQYVTQRQNQIGVTPGLDPAIARPGAIGIYLTLIMEQHGLTDFADAFRTTEIYWSRLYGKPCNGKGEPTSKHIPRRHAPVTVTDPDERVIMQDVFEMLARMFTSQSGDCQLPAHARELCELFATYLEAARNNPGIYYEYQQQRSDTTAAITVIDKMLRRMADHQVPHDDLRDDLIRLVRNECLGFLGHLDLVRWEHERNKVAT